MYLADYHTHTKFSFDSREEPENLCQKAIEKGLKAIAITDHFDCNYDDYEYPLVFNTLERKELIYKLKEKYKGKLDVIYGVELGQPHSRPEIARQLLKDGEFEFVIGSLHNLRELPDFYYFDYTKTKGEILNVIIKKILKETTEVIEFGGIDTLAHLTYIHRYVKAAGNDIDFKIFYDIIESLYRLLIINNISLEINTSTLWKGYGFSMPNDELLKLYYECGGRLITVGSDAHSGENVGGCVEEAYSKLKSLGFKETTVIINGKKELVSL